MRPPETIPKYATCASCKKTIVDARSETRLHVHVASARHGFEAAKTMVSSQCGLSILLTLNLVRYRDEVIGVECAFGDYASM
jgi:hypothetical protein